MREITSRQNPVFKSILAVSKESGAPARDRLFLEGRRLCEDAVRSGLALETLVVSVSAGDVPESLLRAASSDAVRVPDALFRSLSRTVNPQGIGGVFLHPGVRPLPERATGKRYLLMEDVQDPGNVGTMLRTCDAMDFDGVLVTAGTADPFRPKVLRAAMGSTFRIPVYTIPDAAEGIDWLKGSGIRVYAAHLDGTELDRHTFTLPAALLIGNEGVGLSRAAADAADALVRIPMPGRAESLNAACAAAILCYSMHIDAKG